VTTGRQIAAAVALAALVGLTCYGLARTARPRALWTLQGELRAPPTGDGRWAAWLEGDPGEARLVAVRRGFGRPGVVLAEAGLSGLAVAGETAFVTRAGAADGGRPAALLRVSLRGGASEELAALPLEAAQISSGEGWLCWREQRPGGLPGVPFVAAAAPLTVIRALPQEGGQVETVAVLAAEGPRGGEFVELVGVSGRAVYWTERRGLGVEMTTAIRRAALTGGEPETVVREPGRLSAALVGDALVWTGRSAEAADSGQFAAVRRRPLQGGEVEVIGDWLASGASVLGGRDRVYVRDRGHLWSLGRRREEQRALLASPGGLREARLVGDQEYLIMAGRGRTVVARRPVTWWGRVRALVNL